MRRIPKFPPVDYDYIEFDGGLDVDTPALQLEKTYCRKAQNYELGVTGGYRRIAGYERVDGRPAPSDAAYAILNATITGVWAVGNTLTGVTSGATGVIAAATAEYFVLTKTAGTFQAGEDLQIAAVTVAVAGGAQIVDGAATSKLHAQYKNAAADIYRADIAAVPGSGSVLGVVRYNGVVYAFRNNAGGTAAALYRSSVTGWTLVPLGRELAFTSGGAYEIQEGDTITGATSGATAVVTRVVRESGSWSGGTAVGRLIFASQTGVFQAENLNVGANLDVATIAGDSAAITLTVGGRYEFDIKNFGGQAGTKRIYGCSGVQRGFEFDGTVYVPINTGMSPDTPSHVKEHKKHLFFSFASSMQHSGPGTPYIWSPLLGAAELAVGDDITAFVPQPPSEATGGALVAFTRNGTHILYGNSSADWVLSAFSDEEQGAYAYTAQRINGVTLMLDDRGFTSLGTSANYGNFVGSSLSQRIQSLVNEKRLIVTGSCVSRDEAQWRLFFSDGFALYVTFNGKKLRGVMPILFPDAVACVHSRETGDGDEAIYFGSTDGFVYQMEKGTSFDGDDIEAFLHLAWNAGKSVRQRKRYKQVMLECSGDGYAEFVFSYELGYASTDIPQPGNQNLIFNFTPANWDSFVWDSFIWDGVALSPAEMDMDGSAENVSLILRSNGDYFTPSTFSGAIIHSIPRRALR